MSVAGKSHRSGIALLDLARMFPNDQAARVWFESIRWAAGRSCPHCGSERTSAVPRANPMPYHCGGCRKYFSVRTGAVMARSKLGLRKWAFGIYLMSTSLSLKGASNMKLHRDLGITQKTAWVIGQKIREAWASSYGPFSGTVEQTEKRGRGRPTTHPLEQIEATPEEMAEAIFRHAERDSDGDQTEGDY